MTIEIKSPTEIELIPDTRLEDSILRGGNWKCEIVEPKPLDLNKFKMVLTKRDGAVG